MFELNTDRLKLRQWNKLDHELMIVINGDPEVMAFYPSCQTPEQSVQMTLYFERLIMEKGWGFWAVETKHDNQFIGFVGLHEPNFDLPVTPCVEIGWRLGRQYWGNGYASEAAEAVLKFAFSELKLNSVYSFTSQINTRSIAVMEKIGMLNLQQNFNHPIVPSGHELSEHVLYKIER